MQILLPHPTDPINISARILISTLNWWIWIVGLRHLNNTVRLVISYMYIKHMQLITIAWCVSSTQISNIRKLIGDILCTNVKYVIYRLVNAVQMSVKMLKFSFCFDCAKSKLLFIFIVISLVVFLFTFVRFYERECETTMLIQNFK